MLLTITFRSVALPNSGGRLGKQEIRVALDRHWAASDVGDCETQHEVYLEDAVLEYPPVGRAHTRSTHHAAFSCGAAERKALYCEASRG